MLFTITSSASFTEVRSLSSGANDEYSAIFCRLHWPIYHEAKSEYRVSRCLEFIEPSLL